MDVPVKPGLSEDVLNAIDTLSEVVKKFVIQEHLKYLSDVHDVQTYSPEIQNSLKEDTKNLLTKLFTNIPQSIEGAITDSIEDFSFDFESALSDNHFVHTKDAGDLCSCEE